MRNIGVNTWVWFSPPTDDQLMQLIPRIARWGFDVVEIPVEELGQWSPVVVRELLGEHGLDARVCAVMPPGRELVAASADIIRSTQDYLVSVIEVSAAIGSPVVAGPVYSSVGRKWLLSSDERGHAYDEVATNLKPVVIEAQANGVDLAIEPLNRFETSLINTVDQALEIVTRVDSEVVGVAVDTFHASIEERTIANGIYTAGEHLKHVQVCGSDRGAPGGDNIDWVATISALEDIGYDGPLCIESFTSDNETIAVAAAIWRPLAPSQDQLATDGLRFLRSLQPTANAGANPSKPGARTPHSNNKGSENGDVPSERRRHSI